MPKAFATEINNHDKQEIKAAVSSINNLNQQKKAFMSLIALNVLSNYLKEQGVQIISGNNSLSDLLLLKDFDIANIITENNTKIAVRAFVGEDYPQLCIPKSHFQNDFLADIYVGVRLETTIDKAELVGYIELDNINRLKGNDKYVFVESAHLKAIDTIQQAISLSGTRKNICFALDHDKAKELIFPYIENRISSSDKEFFARHISSCSECSRKFNRILELDNMLKSAAFEFNIEENTCLENQETEDINTGEDCTLMLFAGDSSLFGEEVEINIEEEPNEIEELVTVDRKKTVRKRKKRTFERNAGRIIKTAGKLALVSGAVFGGGQVVSAMQAAAVSGMAANAAYTAAVPLAKGIAEALSSISMNEKNSFGDDTPSGSGNFSEFHDDNESNSGSFELDSLEIGEAENFDEPDSANLPDIENIENIEQISEEPENINNFDLDKPEETELTELHDGQEGEELSQTDSVDDFQPEFTENENTEDLESLEETGFSKDENFEGFELESEVPELNNNFDSFEEVNVSDEETDNIQNFESTGDALEETVSLDENLLKDELHEELSELDIAPLKLESAEETPLLEGNDEEQAILSENEPEALSLHMEEEENSLIADNDEKSSSNEMDLGASFDDIAIECNVEDLLASLDNVEVVDSSDFFDFECAIPTSDKQPEKTDSDEVAHQETVKLEKEQKEDIINEIYDDKANNHQEDSHINFNPDSSSTDYDYNQSVAVQEVSRFEEDDNEDEYEDLDDDLAQKKKLDVKLASGIAAAGIAVTVAVALWMNNKPDTNNNMPVLNQPLAQSSGITSHEDVNNQNTDTQQQADNGASGQSLPLPDQQAPNTPPATRDLSAVLAEAFTRRTYEVDIRNISWEITADMAENPVFRNYIMVTGQALKSALARDLASSSETALRTQMKIQTVLDLNGNILEANVVQSSGSKEVDKICLNAYRTTIQFTKLPKIKVNKEKIKANLIISF